MVLLWLRVALICYAVAALAVMPAALYDRPKWRNLALPAAVAGVFFHFVSIAETLVVAHRAVPIGANEVLSVVALVLAAAFVVLALVYKADGFGLVLLPLVVLLALVPAFHPGAPMFDQAYVRTGWLYLHVGLLMAAYAALLVSLVASLLYLLQERRLKQKRSSAMVSNLPALETLDQIALRSLLIGLPMMTLGLLIGSALALSISGPAYFSDPKVLLSLAMWVAYILMIFIRRHSGLRGRRAVYLSSFVFFIVLAVWAANSLSAVHRFRVP